MVSLKMVFLSPSRQMLGQYVEIGYDYLLQNLYLLTVHDHIPHLFQHCNIYH